MPRPLLCSALQLKARPSRPTTLVPQIGPPRAAAFAEAAGAGRLARFSALSEVDISMRALDVLSDAQVGGIAVGLASLSSLESLDFGKREQVPLVHPAAVANRLSLLLPGLTNLKKLEFWRLQLLAGQPPVRRFSPPPPRLLAAAACRQSCRLPGAPLPGR